MGGGRGGNSEASRVVKSKVVLTPDATVDLAEATAWYRERSVRAAEDFLLAVAGALIRIEAQPTANVVVDPETGALPDRWRSRGGVRRRESSSRRSGVARSIGVMAVRIRHAPLRAGRNLCSPTTGQAGHCF